MAGRFVSVPMTFSDRERPDVRNHFFQADLNNARSATSLHLHKCVAQFVSDSWVSCLVSCTHDTLLLHAGLKDLHRLVRC